MRDIIKISIMGFIAPYFGNKPKDGRQGLRIRDIRRTKNKIKDGEFDNVGKCKYEVPDYWTIGAVFERLIEDSFQDEEKAAEGIWEVYHSWIEEHISNYNTDFYYQSREYIALCYKEGEVLE